jgi:protein SCO1/2
MRSVSQALVPPTPTPQIEGITDILPPDPLPDFTLTNHLGEPTRLSDFAGRHVLLFFGYTHCPDYCPLTMTKLRQVKQALGDRANDVAIVFISVDGERDTPEILNDFVTRFDLSFVGLTGDESTLRNVGAPYGLAFELHKENANDTEYLVDHGTLTYVIDPQQRLHALISYTTTADVIGAYLRGLLAANGAS